MEIKLIKEHFYVPDINAYGYIMADGEVFLTLKGEPMNLETFKNKILAVLGFGVTDEKINEYIDIYNGIPSQLGYESKKVIDEVEFEDESRHIVEGLMNGFSGEKSEEAEGGEGLNIGNEETQVVNLDEISESNKKEETVEEVIEKPAPKRRGRRRKED